ncbi:MAG: hypothetical protein H7842_08520, partial [Gammaproteobacteria bacterium SHHR-1]
MRWTLSLLLLSLLPSAALADQERVGDWHFETRSMNGSYSAFSLSASGHYGKSRLQLTASPQKQGPCRVQLAYSLYGPYATGLKGHSIQARVDQDSKRRLRFKDEQNGRTRQGVKFTSGYFDLDQPQAQALVAEMLEGKWLRLRRDKDTKIERFSLAGFSRAARASFYFCKTPNSKDRYPLKILLQKQNDD